MAGPPVEATAPDGGPSLVKPGPETSPAQKARYRANRARRRVIREARSFSGASSAAASLDVQGSSATPPSLPPGTLDLGNGISMILNYTGEFAANPSGGIRQGSAYAGQIAFGLDADLDICAHVMGEHGLARDEIAGLAPVVAEAVAAGDPAAVHIHDQAAAELAAMAEALRTELDFAADEPVPLSWSGGVLSNDPSVRTRLEARLRELGPYVFVEPRHSPAYGAALYAAHQAGEAPR